MLNKYLVNNGTQLVFNGYYMEIYIPQSYFDTKIAENQGSAIRTFGLLNARVFDKNMKELFTELINLPTMIFLYPKETESRTLSVKQIENDEARKYIVAKFYNGDAVTPINIQKDSENVEKFLDLMCNGKIDPTVPYNRLLDVWEKNLELNGIKLNVPSTILGIIIAEIYRDRTKADVKYAKVLGENPKASQHGYRAINIREICARNSTFSAISFEDMDAMITTSLNMKNYNKKQVESPIEKIIKM